MGNDLIDNPVAFAVENEDICQPATREKSGGFGGLVSQSECLVENPTSAGLESEAENRENQKLAKNYALSVLARREHTEKEIFNKLYRKFPDFDPILFNSLISELVGAGYLSEQRFCESYIRSRINKGFGCDRIEKELKEKGLSSSLVFSYLEEYQNQSIDEYSNVYRVWRKKFKIEPLTFRDRVKQSNFLRYRGFSAGEIDKLFGFLV